MTQHELVGEHRCSCGLIASDFSALVIHLIRANGGEFIVSDVSGVQNKRSSLASGQSGDDEPQS